MVVFKCLQLFLIVFCIQGIYTKPAHDEHTESSWIGSTLWGWISYINPWGSSADASAPPTPEENTNSKPVKIKPVVKARQFTAPTFSVVPTAEESASDKSLKYDATTAPKFISVETSTKTKPRAEDSLSTNALLTAVQSAQNNVEKSATEYSIELKTSTSLIALVQYHPTQTAEARLGYHLELEDYSTTPDAPVQDIPKTTQSHTTVDPLELTEPTTPIPVYPENPPITEDFATEQLLEHEASTLTSLNTTKNKEEPTIDILEEEASTTLIMMYLNITTPTEEPTTEQSLDLEITTLSVVPDLGNSITVKKPLESKVTVLNTPKVLNYQLEPEMSTPPIVMVSDFPTSTEEILMEQPLRHVLSTAASALNNPTTEVPTTDDLLESEAATTLTLMDQNTRNTIIRVEIATEHSLLEVTTKEEDTFEAVVPTVAVFTTTLSTDIDGTVTSTQYDTYMGSDEPLVTTEPYLDPYSKLHGAMFTSEEGMSILSDPTGDLLESLHEVMFKPVEVVSTTGPVNDSYQGVAYSVLGRDEVTIEKSEASILTDFVTDTYPQVTLEGRKEEFLEGNKASALTELVTDPFLKFASAVSRSEKGSTETSKGLIQSEAATNPYRETVVVVPERDKESTYGGEGIPAETVTNPYTTKIEEVSDATQLALNQFSKVEEAISTVVKMSEVNTVLRAVNEVMFTEKYEVIDVSRVSRSHSAGIKVSFDHRCLIILLYAVYFMKFF